MADCVTQRKPPGTASSQPLRHRGPDLNPFRARLEWRPQSEWTIAQTENGRKTKQERRNVIIGFAGE